MSQLVNIDKFKVGRMNPELSEQARVCIQELHKFNEMLKTSPLKLSYLRNLLSDLIRLLNDLFPEPKGKNHDARTD